MNKDIFIGVDLGTGSIKAVALDIAGHCVAEVKRPVATVYAPGGIAEQSPLDWLDLVGDCLREMAARLESLDYRPAGIAATGQMNAPILLDDYERPMGPVPIWCDSRCSKQCTEMEERIPFRTLLDLTGHTAVTGYTAPKLLWIKEHAPDQLNQATRLIFPKDVITHALTGISCSDLSDASNSLLLDIHQGKWSESIIEALEISRDILPPLYSSAECIGTISRQGSAWSGLPEGVPVAAGAGDSIACALGAGLTDSTMIQIVIGTAGNVNVVFEQPQIDQQGCVHTGCYVDRQHWICSGVQQTAGAALQWWSEITDRTPEQLFEELNDLEVFSGLRFAPYLSGERTPHLDPDVRAAFLRLERSTRRQDMTCAILEGVAFSFRDALEIFNQMGVRSQRAVLCGGGAGNPLWSSIIATVLDMPVVRQTNETTARGAAILAACSAGLFPHWKQSVNAWQLPGSVITPRVNWSDRCCRAYADYRLLYPLIKNCPSLSEQPLHQSDKF